MLIIESGLLSWPACRILYTVLVIKPTHCDFNQSVSSANHQKSSASDCAYSVLRRYLLFIKKIASYSVWGRNRGFQTRTAVVCASSWRVGDWPRVQFSARARPAISGQSSGVQGRVGFYQVTTPHGGTTVALSHAP